MIKPYKNIKQRINSKGYKKNKEDIDKLNFCPDRQNSSILYHACKLIIINGLSVVQAAKEVNISHSTLYSYIRNNLQKVDKYLYKQILDFLPILKYHIEKEEELGPSFKTIY